MDKYGVSSTHEAIKNKMLDYINTVYLGKNDWLREACKEDINKQGILYQKPYVEANPAYLVCNNGIENADIPADVKKIFNEMIKRNLGVFADPYKHQVDALEAFYHDYDLFIATGTGSGKTECFMWPLVSKLVKEQMERPSSWKVRGVRAIMLYPMNALVSDQLGRLRKMIGNSEHGFHELLSELVPGNRVPQFGMYTGRTPYPGESDVSQNNSLANTMKRDILDQPADVKEKLSELGKYPSKSNLEEYITRLGEKNPNPVLTNPLDAELITRQEIQQNCPDILITNYSMLEYMLMRPIEQSIWKSTKEWLRSDKDNKLLFIIDEAHMYRGSAGGEVALLIRRVLHKLGIKRNQVQFILTSASVPTGKDKDVLNFACDLSAQSRENNTFVLINGTQEEVIINGFEFDPKALYDFHIDELQNETTRMDALREFARLVGIIDMPSSDDEVDVSSWLFGILRRCNPMLRIMKTSRGHATEVTELARIAFPDSGLEEAEKATNVLLAVAPLAKNIGGSVLYPARLHLFFRGLQGIFACSNPSCECAGENERKIGLGKIYLYKPGARCKCGGMIYELLNERSCGAIFLKGYRDITEQGKPFVWNEPGFQFTGNLKEVHYYIIPNDGSFSKTANVRKAWLNSITGRLDEYNDHPDEREYIHVAFCDSEIQGRPDIWTFKTCPKCSKLHFAATDFSTKGNEPFFNLVSEQFYVQPPVSKYKEQDNQGRKVLLFSDSRQRAAVLARDLTRAADEDAMKKALTVAACELQEWAKKEDKIPTLNLLYVVFLKVAYENKLRFFYGANEKDLADAVSQMGEKYAKRGGKVKYDMVAKTLFKAIPEQYYEHLLSQLCNNFRSLTDVGLCWLEPCDIDDETFEDIEDSFAENKVNMSLEEFKILFSAWAMEIMTSQYAIGSEIDDSVRRNLTAYHQRLGVEDENVLAPRIKKILEKKGYSKDNIKIITKELARYLMKGVNTQVKYLNLDMVSLRYDENHEWYKCPRCSGVFPFALWGKCAHCGEGSPVLMQEKDFGGINFWRMPVLKAVHRDPTALMTRINTEEHTAQLSHKDQRQNTWSTTEDYEMRFQNVHIDNDRPVDVLSCTTTMEVGIDIGSLTAVGLRNIPPMRENYQQRAGRAGRRSAAISTIVTYTDNRPHDSYYFHNPQKIISGEPRTPWIDVANLKLVNRHFSVILINEYFNRFGIGIDKVGIVDFYEKYFEQFENYVRTLQEHSFDLSCLIPEMVEFDFEKSKESLVEQLKVLGQKVKDFPDEYKDDNNEDSSTLDVLLESGIFPTYSFPKDVIGFHVENRDGSKIVQKPDRSIEQAISDYAPGRLVVINKTTYKSGGLYSFHSKFRPNEQEHPARPFFASREYYRNLYYCNNMSCNWMGLEFQSECPFCGGKTIEQQNLVKPWGFAPINGVSTKEIGAEAEITYAEDPCYSLTPKETEMISVPQYDHLRFSRRSSDPLIILNRGEKGSGFIVCKDCGAAVPGNDYEQIKKIRNPYRHPYVKYYCSHPETELVNTYLGQQFRTDMVLYEICLDTEKVNADTSGMWIRRAGQTLAEAMTLAGGRLLDIEFNEIKSGYRIRYSQEEPKAYVDVFLFDSLSSGAGYCAALAEKTGELIEATRKVLKECPAKCDSACHECLMHYWNQRVQSQLDRFAALELLDWCEKSEIPDALSYELQETMLNPLRALDAEFEVSGDGKKHYVCKGAKRREIYIYPAMWSGQSKLLPVDAIALSDKLMKYALPKVDSIVRSEM